MPQNGIISCLCTNTEWGGGTLYCSAPTGALGLLNGLSVREEEGFGFWTIQVLSLGFISLIYCLVPLEEKPGSVAVV